MAAIFLYLGMIRTKRIFKKVTADIFSLFSASFLGQLVHIIALPYLSAYFSKDQIGAFFFFQALVTMGAIFVSLQSELAIVVEGDKRSYTTFKKSVLVIGLISLIIYLLIFSSQSIWQLILTKSSIHDWILYVPIALFITGINKSTEYLFTHEKRFKLISWIKITRPILIYMAIICFKLLAIQNKNILIHGFISGIGILTIFQLLIISGNKLCWFNRNDFSFSELKKFFVRHKKILLFNTLSTGIASVSMQMPYVFINAFYGESFSAYYGMAMRIIGMPFGLLGQSVGQVYFQKFSQLNYFNHSLYPTVRRLIFKIYTIGIIPLLLLLVALPWIFQFFLGPGWDTAAQLSVIILPWLFVLMVSAPISNIISVISIQLQTIYYGIALLICRFLGLYLCSLMGMDFLSNLAVFSFIGVVFGIYFQYFLLQLSGKRNISV